MAPSALAAGNPDEGASSKAALRAARAQRFKRELPGNRFKELEEARKIERRQFEERGLITAGRVGLADAIDMRGTCEDMCCEYEREFREFINSIDRFERLPSGRLDHSKAVAAYTRSEAGAGEGDAAVLPSDLRTPAALVRSLDYLFDQVMSIPPPASASLPNTARTALGNSFGFIRDRTKAIRKEFAMQSSWGHQEAIASIERVARFHILCLRELQEETGPNSDMHQDADQLGRCFVSLRQHYNDRREEARIEMPCENEPEFQAYMLIFDLNAKTAAIQSSELPGIILDHPLVKLAWEIRRAAQRNFDTQKEGSKGNAELGMNLINRFVRLLKDGKVPYLLACLVEIRLREMRRSALRALQRTYPRLKQEPIRLNENGEIVERRMVLIKTLDAILGCEEQEDEPAAFNDVAELPRYPDVEAADVARRFDVEIYEHNSEPIGALIHLGAYFDDNKDAPYTRRWKSITEKRGSTPFVEIVNGRACVHIDGVAPAPRIVSAPRPTVSFPKTEMGAPARRSAFAFAEPVKPALPTTTAPVFSFTKPAQPASTPSLASTTTFGFNFGKPAISDPPVTQPTPAAVKAPEPPSSSIPTFNFAKPAPSVPAEIKAPTFSFAFGKTATAPVPASTPTSAPTPIPAAVAPQSAAPAPLFTTPGFFSGITATAGPSTTTLLPRQPSPKAKSPVVLSEKALGKQPQVLPSPAQSLRLPKSNSLSTSRRLNVTSEAERQRRKRVLPSLTNELIDQVIESYMTDLTPDLLRLLAQEKARQVYESNIVKRATFIHDMADRLTEALIEEVISNVGRVGLLEETRRRWLIRKTVRHWKSWARRTKHDRERSKKIRDETFDRLARMGLGGDSMTPGLLPDRKGGSEMGDLTIDMELREAARVNERFYAPSTLLSVIARHVAPLLEDSYPAAVPSSPTASPDGDGVGRIRWSTIISTASAAGTPSEEAVSKWLISKFSTSDEGGQLDYGECSFATEVVARYDEATVTDSIGLVVFEVPVRTYDPHSQQENIADAQDRLTALIKAGKTDSNRYDPVLLLVTWENETVDAIAQRLEIKEDLTAFQQVGVLSLEFTDDVERQLEMLLRDVIEEISPKQRVELYLEDVVNRASEPWSRFIAVIDIVLAQPSDDPIAILRSFHAGIETLICLPNLARSAYGKKKLSKISTFDPISLPPFDLKNHETLNDAAERIIEYLEHDVFRGVDDLALLITPLRHAIASRTVPPISPILASLAFLVFGDLRPQVISLKSFLHSPAREDTVERYLTDIADKFSIFVSQQIGMITALPPQVTMSVVPRLMPRTSPTSASSAGRGTKRTRDDVPSVGNSPKSESKASKNARLRAALEEVNKTLEGIERGWMDVDGVLSA